MAIACPNAAGDTSVATGTSSPSLSAPANWTTGDVLVAFKCDRATSGTTTTTGWSRIASAAAASTYRMEVFVTDYATAGAGPWSFTGTTRTLVRCLRFTGVDNTTPSDCTATARSNASGTTGTTSITPVTSGAWVVGGFAATSSGSQTWSAEACATDPTTLTEQQESAYSTYHNLAVCAAAQTAGPQATGASSGTMSTNGVNTAGLMALRPAPETINFTHQGNLKAACTWKSDRTIEKIIGAVSQTKSWYSAADSWVKLIGTIRMERAWDSDILGSQIDFTHQGALAQAGTWTSQRLIERIITSNLNQVETYASVRGIEKLIVGLLSQEEWNASTRIVEKVFNGGLTKQEWYTSDLMTEHLWQGALSGGMAWDSDITYEAAGALLNFVYQAQLAQTGTWQSQRVVEKVINSTLNAADTWQSVRGIEKVIQGSLSDIATWQSVRSIGKVIQGALAQMDTWQSQRLIEKVVQGGLSAVETWQAIRTIEKVINGALSPVMTWEMYFDFLGGTVLNFLHTGALAQEKFLLSDRTLEHLWQGAIAGTQTWLTEKQIEKVIQGALSQEETWKIARTIERIIEGGTQDTESWASQVLREAMILGQLMQLKTWNSGILATNFNWIGTLSKTQSWGSTICVDYKWLGALAQTKTWGSAYWKAHDMLHQGAINQAKTWASTKSREHLVVGNLNLEKWLRQFPPFGEVWDKDSGTTTGWTKKSEVSGIWTKQSPTTESWNKRGKAS